MLIITRRSSEAIIINDNISIRILNVDKNHVKIGIEAPREISVHRKEIHDKINFENRVTKK